MSPRARALLLLIALSTPATAQVTTQNRGARPLGRGPSRAIPGPSAHADEPPAQTPASLTPSLDFRDHFGVDLAARLFRSNRPEDRLRGLERAGSIGTPEAVSLITHALKESQSPLGPDTRALLVAVRSLADATNQSEARSFLKDSVLNLAVHQRPATSTTEPDTLDEDRDARMALARSEAAFALATSADPAAIDAVLLVARDQGPGQVAAMEAVVAFPPERVAAIGTGLLSPALLHLAGKMGDLRTLDAARAALHATDPPTRAAALDAVSAMGDTRAIGDARTMSKDADPVVRVAAGRALVRLGAPDRYRAVEALVGDDDTALEGVRIAAGGGDAGVAKALAARVKASGEPDLRALAIVALGRSEANEAVEALRAFVLDPVLSGDAAAALARSPNAKGEAVLESLLGTEGMRRLGARAYVLRALTREPLDWGTNALRAMARSPDARDRAVGLGGLILLGEEDAIAALRDPDAGVRRIVATAAMADGRRETRRALLSLSRSETDPLVRKVEWAALVGGDDEGLVTTTRLAERATMGEADGPLAAMALAARRDESERAKVGVLLASEDPLLRAHAARGLGESPEADAVGRLARAFAFEVDPLVRRAIVAALARRGEDDGAPARLAVLKSAARLDPDRTVRSTARRALAGLAPEPSAPARMELVWLHLTAGGGGPPPASVRGGLLLRSDGLAVPVAFDADGYALVPIPPGESRLLLEPRVPAYESAP
jgi:HEAT repeat protein